MIAPIPLPLTAGEFAPFGEVLSFNETRARLVNNGHALRSDLPARLAFSAGEPRLALYRFAAQPWPVTIPEMECHPNSLQTFLPVTAKRFLVVVAPVGSDGLPDAMRCQAFVGQRHQAFIYRPGVWHALIVALDECGDFLTLIWEQGAAADCRVERLPRPVLINPGFD